MRLVIADDHHVVREGLRWMLDPEPGIDIVAEASTGAELLRTLAGETVVDIVLLDLRMPDMSGFEVLEQMTTTAPDTSVLIMTAHDDPAYVRRALELGACGYLLKNVAQVELVRALHHCSRGEVYVQGDLSGSLLGGGSGAQSHGSGLSPRELEVLQMIADGSVNKQIASSLGISEATVKWCLKNVFAKLDVTSRAEAVAASLRLELIS